METTRRLQRDTQHKVIGGVCSGLANYFGIDVTLIRVLFAVALLAYSSGFWIYVILWIVMPSATIGGAQSFVETQNVDERNKKSSLTAGLILIVLGVCFLLGNFIPKISWRTSWPVLLIVLGLSMIIPFNNKKS